MNARPGAERTLPALLARNAAARPGGVALRQKARGIWHETTWSALAARVRNLALGLERLGLGRGGRLAIASGNRPEWLVAELAAQALGAVAVGIDPEVEGDALPAAIGREGATVALAEDQEQVDKLLASVERIPGLRHVLFVEPRGLRRTRHDALAPLAAVEEQGAARHAAEPRRFGELLAELHAGAAAFVPSAPGAAAATAPALSGEQLLAAAGRLLARHPRSPGDEVVSFVPLAWESEQVASVAASLSAGSPLNFPESAETLRSDLREIGPHALVAPDRYWNGLHGWVQERLRETTPFKRRMFDRWLPRGAPGSLHELLLLRPLRDRLGLTQARLCATPGDPPAPEAAAFFAAIGRPVLTLDLAAGGASPLSTARGA